MQSGLDWSLGEVCQITVGEYRLCVEPRHPSRGGELRVSDHSLGQLFELPPAVFDSLETPDVFSRQNDLSLRYPQTVRRPIDLHLTWRAHDYRTLGRDHLPARRDSNLASDISTALPPVLIAELILSIQTELLDAAPIRESSSRIRGGQAGSLAGFPPMQIASIESRQSEFATLVRSGRSSILIAYFPTDLRWLAIHQEGDCLIEATRLRSDPIEKGVIRRFRMLVAVTDTAQERWLHPVPAWFCASRLPLSA